jgi:integrase/recombinase XerD
MWIKAGTYADAKKLKKNLESMENSKRIAKLGLTSKSIRIDDFFQKYVEFAKSHSSEGTFKRYRGVVNFLIAFLKMYYPRLKHLHQINREHLEEYQQARLTDINLKIAADGDKPGNHKKKKLPLPQTVNYELSVLRSAFIWAQDREWISVVPTKKVKRLKVSQTKRKKILTPDECKLFLETAKRAGENDSNMKVFSQVFTFLLNTGLRSGEICHLTWDDIDLDTGIIKIQAKEGWTPKTYEREFILNKVCINLLKSIHRKDSEGYIFKRPNGVRLDDKGLRRALIKAAKLAGIRNFTRVHDLRHTFNSIMQMNGVDAPTMTRILGHRDLETTMIYTHQTQRHLKDSINKIGFK